MKGSLVHHSRTRKWRRMQVNLLVAWRKSCVPHWKASPIPTVTISSHAYCAATFHKEVLCTGLYFFLWNGFTNKNLTIFRNVFNSEYSSSRWPLCLCEGIENEGLYFVIKQKFWFGNPGTLKLGLTRVKNEDDRPINVTGNLKTTIWCRGEFHAELQTSRNKWSNKLFFFLNDVCLHVCCRHTF